MKSNYFTLTALVFSVLLLAGFANAELIVSANPTTSTIYPGNSTSFVLTISNNYTDINISNIVISPLTLASGSNTITLTSNDTSFNLTNGTSKAVLLTATTSSSQSIGTYSRSLNISGQNSSNVSQPLFLTTQNLNVVVSSLPKNLCKISNLGDLEVEIDEINVDEGFGDEDDFWYPFDSIIIDVDVSNEGDSDIQDIEMDFCLLDVDSGKCIMDEDDVDFSEDKFDLDDGDDISLTVRFKVNSEVLDEDIDNLEIHISATGDIDDKDSVDDGKASCSSDSQSIDVNIQEEFVILTDFDEEYNAACGSSVEISGDAWNIDDGDLEDVTIEVINRELGISKEITVGDIDGFDSTPFSVVLSIPANATAKTYNLEFTVYDEDNDVFENDEDDTADFDIPLVVSGNCQTTPKISITANLSSGAKMGENLIIHATIANLGTTADFIINPSGFESWADLVSVEPQTLNIPSAGSRQVTITLLPSESGIKTFNIEARTTTGQTVSQQVQVTVAGTNGFFSYFSDLGSTAIFLIIAIIVVFILIVIVAIIKVSSGRKKTEF